MLAFSLFRLLCACGLLVVVVVVTADAVAVDIDVPTYVGRERNGKEEREVMRKKDGKLIVVPTRRERERENAFAFFKDATICIPCIASLPNHFHCSFFFSFARSIFFALSLSISPVALYVRR